MYRTSSHDLFADAFFILNERLMFASLYGRDANMLSMLALMNNNGGVDLGALGFRDSDDQSYHPPRTTARYFFDLYKHMTKISTHNYGVLTHAFVYSSEIVKYDFDSKTAWLVSADTEADLTDQVWCAINGLTDVPLLDSWARAVLLHLQQQECVRMYPPGISEEAALVGVQACRIRIPDDFSLQISHWLKTGVLSVKQGNQYV